MDPFGHTSLYQALQASPSSTPKELKRAYRRAALRYHPDHAATSNALKIVDSTPSTLKFQAVLAAYQVLMDESKRSVYDATGTIVDEYDYDDVDGSDVNSSHRSRKCNTRQQWESFFYSVFDEIIHVKTTAENHARSYPGSSQERSDVLRFYSICRGDWAKILECISYGDEGDVEQWKKEVVGPAIQKGEVNDFHTQVENTIQTRRKNNEKIITLDDSSEEEVRKSSSNRNCLKKKRISVDMKVGADFQMSKRDKLEYHTAKKRKEKFSRDVNLATVMSSKHWGDGFPSTATESADRGRGGSLSARFLNDIEKKYAGKKCVGLRIRSRSEHVCASIMGDHYKRRETVSGPHVNSLFDMSTMIVNSMHPVSF
ncbi:hypothetical protein HJC23_008217 [Cyclotella cryptica]|uniref:J domain-containing protein n=1 Tax=Cyclotella cryptica TaxID=29204 RepID=A0ABD3NLF0_9STRA